MMDEWQVSRRIPPKKDPPPAPKKKRKRESIGATPLVLARIRVQSSRSTMIDWLSVAYQIQVKPLPSGDKRRWVPSAIFA